MTNHKTRPRPPTHNQIPQIPIKSLDIALPGPQMQALLEELAERDEELAFRGGAVGSGGL